MNCVIVTCRFSRAKRLELLCNRFENTWSWPHMVRLWAWEKIALSFHPALPLQNSFIIILHADTFDEESPETKTNSVPTWAIPTNKKIRKQLRKMSETKQHCLQRNETRMGYQYYHTGWERAGLAVSVYGAGRAVAGGDDAVRSGRDGGGQVQLCKG